jgi:hypothetical protein
MGWYVLIDLAEDRDCCEHGDELSGSRKKSWKILE